MRSWNNQGKGHRNMDVLELIEQAKYIINRYGYFTDWRLEKSKQYTEIKDWLVDYEANLIDIQ